MAAVRTRVVRDPEFGECLFADNGAVEIAIPLSYGIRVARLALCGGENLFFAQPADMVDLTTPEGWRVRGGHRLWLAPESERVYYPDNEPVEWEAVDGGVRVTQPEDPWLRVRKRMTLRFGAGAQLRVVHSVENAGDSTLRCALWGISSMASGGVQRISLPRRSGGYDPLHHLSLWDYTSLSDPRATYELDGITLRHAPLEQRYKIGVGHPLGAVEYENAGVCFSLESELRPGTQYPDGGVSYETFMCRHMVEMETLSPLGAIAPGERMEHHEVWTLRKGGEL